MAKIELSMWAVAVLCGAALTWPAFAGRSEVTVVCHDGPHRGVYVADRRDVVQTPDGMVIVTARGRIVVDSDCGVRW